MKHFLLTCIGIIIGLGETWAEQVYLQRIPKGKNECSSTTVTYDEETVCIVSTSEILNAHIIIRNLYGDIIYECIIDLPSTNHTIELPDYYDSKKDSIEITTEDGQTLFGYFM